jgi:hypothetical protein
MKTPQSPSPLIQAAPCLRCGYQMEGIVLDTTAGASATQWKAVCPECGHDNFGPLLKPGRAPRWGWAAIWLAVAAAVVGVLAWLD